MANFIIPENPAFTQEIRKFDPTDPAHADLFNTVIQALVTNDAFLKKQAQQAMQDNEEVVDALNSAIVTKANKEEFEIHKNATDSLLGTQDISAIGDGTVTGGISALNTGVERINTALAGISLRVLTQAQYNALGSKDAQTLYVIVG
ncbi:MAG: hypothetical protein HFH91_07875 [Lachnospiraceae bacterium]|nr:hypothetical protein [Lachnospiraceae bacterium]